MVAEIKMGTKDFTKILEKKSGIDEEKEELLGVENMIKVVDLERKYNILKEEKDKQIKEKDKQLKEKDKEIDRLKTQLKSK